MPTTPKPAPFTLERPDGVELAGEVSEGERAIVLLHGLTATRRYVVHGSRGLERRGHRVVAYDARGHGESSAPVDPAAYGYEHMVSDLEAVLDRHGMGSTVLVGHSMGAAVAVAFALRHPVRVGALVQITPAYPGHPADASALAGWESLADGLERRGVEGFLAAYDSEVDERWRDQVFRFTRQRLERHRDLGAVADAMRVVPRSVAFHGLEALERIEAPVLVVGSRDEADPAHPLSIAESYAERLPRAELLVEEPGEAPLAWRGAELSRVIAEFLA